MTEKKNGSLPEGQESENQAKADDVETLKKQLAEVEKSKTDYETRLKDRDETLGRQSRELGELRKFREEIAKKKEDTDKSDAEKLAEHLMETEPEAYLDKANALYSAKLMLAKDKYREKQSRESRHKEMVDEGLELINDDFEDGKMKKDIFTEHEKEIWSEVDKFKLPKTARAMRRLVREAYQNVKRKKADAMRDAKRTQEEIDRDKMIDGQRQPDAKKAQKLMEDAEEKEKKDISSAGTNPLAGSVF